MFKLVIKQWLESFFFYIFCAEELDNIVESNTFFVHLLLTNATSNVHLMFTVPTQILLLDN